MHIADSSLAEAQRQFLICSACRFCEGYCATFPAIEGRTTYTAADVAYIANLCHDCRACAQACMYASPHEFAVDIPRLLGSIRLQTYGARAAGLDAAAAAGAALAVLLAAIALDGRWDRFTTPHAEPGAFYEVVPYLWMLVPALLISVWAAIILVRAARRLVGAVAPDARASLRDRLGALTDGVELVYLRGGGGGCYYPRQDRPSSARRILHIVLVAGAGLTFVATLAAAILQDALDQLPPYPLVSVPVLSGTIGGIFILASAIGLVMLKIDPAARNKTAAGTTALDIAFLALLAVVAATGLLLLCLRTSSSMGALLAVHLAAVAGLLLTAPYGKFLHVPLRLASLLVFRIEEAQRSDSAFTRRPTL
jgi:citrate/tricarballylate utilization protein